MDFRAFYALSAILALCVMLAGCTSQDRVVVYSPHGPDVLGDYKALFEAAYPGATVHALDMGSQDVLTRVRAERNRPAADVWWGAPTAMFIAAAQEGLLEPYQPEWADQVDAAHRDAGGHWYGTYRSPLAILYNERGYTQDEVPQIWDELLDPQWHGKIAIRYMPDSGTMQTFIGAAILRAGSEEAGLDWLRRLHAATGAYPRSPQMLYDHLRRNNDRISVWLLPDIILQRERHGSPFGAIVPPETPALIEGIALIRNGPNPERARQFYEFVTTREAFAHQAEAYAKIPVRKDIEPDDLPAWMREIRIDEMPIDWADFSERVAGWTGRWIREVYQGP